MRSWLLTLFGLMMAGLIGAGVLYQKHAQISTQKEPSSFFPEAPHGLTSSPSPLPSEAQPEGTAPPLAPGTLSSAEPQVSSSPLPQTSPTPEPSASAPVSDDLSVDSSGLSKVTATLRTSKGLIRFKFYPQDAPKTTQRILELIHQGFYNGLTFHRVVAGFIVQAGDPSGNGTGGSGKKLAAEFNHRKHIEGTLAMARDADPDSADSQFYISLGTHPHLDQNYTVFGQVIEGMNWVRGIRAGDQILSLSVQSP
ncbi:MAG: peptidylprolyl isomerase [Bdellovibrionia bacterium]